MPQHIPNRIYNQKSMLFYIILFCTQQKINENRQHITAAEEKKRNFSKLFHPKSRKSKRTCT